MLPTSEGLAGTWEASLTPALFAHQRTLSAPCPSPDGRRFAFVSEYDARSDLFVQGDGGWPVQVTAAQAIAGGSYDWSPDGSRIVFTSAADGKLWLCDASASRSPKGATTPPASRRMAARSVSSAIAARPWMCSS
jgi:Tol biopolymer transport system component